MLAEWLPAPVEIISVISGHSVMLKLQIWVWLVFLVFWGKVAGNKLAEWPPCSGWDNINNIRPQCYSQLYNYVFSECTRFSFEDKELPMQRLWKAISSERTSGSTCKSNSFKDKRFSLQRMWSSIFSKLSLDRYVLAFHLRIKKCRNI